MNKALLFTCLGLLLLLSGCQEEQILYMCFDGSPGGAVIPDTTKDILFVCPDGTQSETLSDCTFEPVVTISQDDAESKSLNFVNGYVRSNGWSTTLINTYADEGNFYSQLVLSKQGESPYETVVEIDGSKGIASCFQNCLYTS
jgi:hypothetical protein